jgi:hypothetical protein
MPILTGLSIGKGMRREAEGSQAQGCNPLIA